jgi:threonine/homoserine/homoserine lactone efflux protein
METFLPLLGFVVAASVTPGPNNLMVLTSGANFGVRRTLPHIIGISIGFPVMIIAVGLGISLLFDAAPWLHRVLQYLAFVYLCWLAWRIATAGRPEVDDPESRPLTVFEAALFQWVNPKGWAMVLGAMALFVSPNGNRAFQVAVIAILFGAVCFPNCVGWAMFGRAISGFLADDRRRRWFNMAMAVLLVLSAIPALFETPAA